MSEEFKDATRQKSSNFTRKRKLPFDELVLFLLKGAYKSLSVEVQTFLRSLGKKTTPLSKQAISKAREKINHRGFVIINDTLIKSYYEEPYKTYKGYRLLAADGSMIELPTGDEITRNFGKMNNNPTWLNAGWAMTIFDPLNNLIVNSSLNKYGSSEQGYLEEGLRRMKESGLQEAKDLIVVDRGFPSLALMLRLKAMGYGFVMRFNTDNFLKEFRGFSKSENQEEVIKIDLGDKVKGRWRKLEKLQLSRQKVTGEDLPVRVVKALLPNGSMEYLVTSELSSSELSREDLLEIYRQRWMIEEWYKSAKTTMEIENFSGKTPENILQDYHAKIALYNLHSVVVAEAQMQLDKELEKGITNGELRYAEYEINQNVSYGIVRDAINDLLMNENGDWAETYEHLVRTVKLNPIPKREGRNHPRQRKWKHKFPDNRRRSV